MSSAKVSSRGVNWVGCAHSRCCLRLPGQDKYAFQIHCATYQQVLKRRCFRPNYAETLWCAHARMWSELARNPEGARPTVRESDVTWSEFSHSRRRSWGALSRRYRIDVIFKRTFFAVSSFQRSLFPYWYVCCQ